MRKSASERAVTGRLRGDRREVELHTGEPGAGDQLLRRLVRLPFQPGAGQHLARGLPRLGSPDARARQSRRIAPHRPLAPCPGRRRIDVPTRGQWARSSPAPRRLPCEPAPRCAGRRGRWSHRAQPAIRCRPRVIRAPLRRLVRRPGRPADDRSRGAGPVDRDSPPAMPSPVPLRRCARERPSPAASAASRDRWSATRRV